MSWRTGLLGVANRRRVGVCLEPQCDEVSCVHGGEDKN